MGVAGHPAFERVYFPLVFFWLPPLQRDGGFTLWPTWRSDVDGLDSTSTVWIRGESYQPCVVFHR